MMSMSSLESDGAGVLSEPYQRTEDFQKSPLESSEAGNFEKRCVGELMMSMSPLESNGAEILLKRHVRELRIS